MDVNQTSVPVVLDAYGVAALPELTLGESHAVTHRVLWSDGQSSAGVLHVPAGERLGRHTHRANDHHMWVIDGHAEILGTAVGPGSYSHIPFGVEHDIDASATEGCTVFYLYGRRA